MTWTWISPALLPRPAGGASEGLSWALQCHMLVQGALGAGLEWGPNGTPLAIVYFLLGCTRGPWLLYVYASLGQTMFSRRKYVMFWSRGPGGMQVMGIIGVDRDRVWCLVYPAGQATQTGWGTHNNKAW